ncbi:MAG: DUF541 domain-containing protein [Bacteroidetes bacterium]|nr:MAG: DUF541 domain-containing protein [Bacteroidota bacterium]
MLRIFTLSIVIWCFVGILFAQEYNDTSNQISVFGSVELKEVADRATLVFSIQGFGSTLRQAVENSNDKSHSVAEKLLALGLGQKNIATSQFYSGENYGDKPLFSSSKDFKAMISTMVTVDSMALLDSILYLISENEVEDLSNLTFSLKDELSVRKKARISAILKAKEKAEDLVTALGLTLGKPLLIEEIEPTVTSNQTNDYSTMFLRGGRLGNPFNPITISADATYDESKGIGFFAQTISITSQVRVVFEIK